MDQRLVAADRILNRGVQFRLPAPFLSRLLKRNRIIVRPLMPGTIFEFSTIVLENNLEEATTLSDYAALVKSIKPIARCIAVAMLNDEKGIAARTERLQQKLLWKVNPQFLVQIYLAISEMNRSADFTTITRYFVVQTLMMMNPNLGQ